ncbi:1-deoxy-D-xylulose-5-phosphate synthase [Rhodobacterales bacterium HTCC2654]|uniref:1-deoxy-D-xylulose-5-phosphate synthase n=1 Tax=Maritimibacter alkaliphilus HTCC2654 TaxID=314271 RepID=A3VGY8_9RHOB|nr:1-deoxy-D-xylulose-5-phosphate synthase [Rhodobacterales bacterium HTCC2654] [Maritimibacter alkaliphilus HTCC2654]
MHKPHAFQSQHVRDFVRVGEHARRAVRDHGGGEFRRGQHTAFDMHMGVAQAGDQVLAVGVDHLGVVGKAMAGVRTDVGEPPLSDCDLPAVQHFARVDVHDFGAFDDEVGSLTTRSHSDKARCGFGPRFQWSVCHGAIVQQI